MTVISSYLLKQLVDLHSEKKSSWVMFSTRWTWWRHFTWSKSAHIALADQFLPVWDYKSIHLPYQLLQQCLNYDIYIYIIYNAATWFVFWSEQKWTTFMVRMYMHACHFTGRIHVYQCNTGFPICVIEVIDVNSYVERAFQIASLGTFHHNFQS